MGFDHIVLRSGPAFRAPKSKVSRPRPLGSTEQPVNVFFDFKPLPTYQCNMATKPPASSLDELRKEIDRLDEAMHRLLMERGEIIDRLIEVKKSQETGGSAFRPAREAEMMRRLVGRHEGILPLDTVESIWRVIIATFTYVQAPFSVHADLSAGDVLMRDSARFHFGFTVPFVPHMGAAGVVAAVSESIGDLGLVPAFPVASAGAWWNALEFDTAPKIIARLPFVERPDHPAALPVFVVSHVAADAMAMETSVWSIRVSGWSQHAAQALSKLTDFFAVPDRAFDGAALLITLPANLSLDTIGTALVETGATLRSATLVGSHATRYTVAAEKKS
jgi:chorismate mutase